MFDKRLEVSPMYSDPSYPINILRNRARALDVWRAAAELVWTRWEAYLGAASETRTGAYAAYVAALDAESAAGEQIAAIPLVLAA